MNNIIEDKKIYHLDNSYCAELIDKSSHYFGGYYHIKLEVSVNILLLPVFFASEELYDDACKMFGRELKFVKMYEKMGVSKDDLQQEKEKLKIAFEKNLLPYLNRKDFPSSFAESEYKKGLKKRVERFKPVE